MDSEQRRLQSFENWPPHAPVAADALAEAGFFYQGKEDEVTCFTCRYSLSQWERGDDPWAEHRRHNPNCDLVVQHDHGGETFDSAMIKPPDNSTGTTASDSVQIKPPDNRAMTVLVEKTANLGLRRKPTPTDYSKREERLSSFKTWRQEVPDPLKLVDAGFYYSGEGDIVYCYSCGNRFENWNESLDPYKLHQQISKDCKFFLTDGKPIISGAQVERTQDLGSKLEVRHAEDLQSGGPTRAASREQDHKSKEMVTKTEEKPNARICSTCKTNSRDVLFEPCEHFVACWKCAQNMLKCPKCHLPITSKTQFPE